ncbi:MAG: DNA polymerase III subunit alpha [Actinobacteria bacterium]|nr:DNA polymerase III subunit alpha [Actinomycetota bacterium]
MSTPPYAELHAHSAFSFLDGASLPSDLVEAAAKLGYSALALTDHDGVWGSREFAENCRGLTLRAITGAELSVNLAPPSTAGDPVEPELIHLTLLVETAAGYRNLCRLLTAAHAHTRDNNTRTAMPPWATLAQLEAHAEGLVCLSGCARDGALAGSWERGDSARGERLGRRLLAAFGPDRFRVELQRPYWRHDRARNRWLSLLASRLGVATVATGNVHAHARRRAHLQDALVAVGRNETLEASEPHRRGNASSFLAPPAAMAARFAEHPEAVAETLRLAERLEFDLTTELGYRYPQADGADRKLAELCRSRLADRYAGEKQRGKAEKRLEQELATISRRDLSGFFLLHHELLELAREVADELRGREAARALLPPGRGRGSSVSSIVCYLTGLSHIDPVHNNLFAGRFLNDGVEGSEAAMPDIDLDFPRDIREVLIPRVHEAYGGERSALVAAFPTYRPRGIVRDLGKALGLPPAELDRVAKVVGFHETAGEIERDLTAALGRRRAREPRWRQLLALGREALRLPRGASQHSGGMVISTQPLVEICPIVPAAMAGRQIIQWDKDSCTDAGLLKIDLLGLGMLSAVERCVDEIEAAEGEAIDLSRLALDDAKTFESIRAAETTGVFQIESRAQMQMLPRTQPQTIDDLTIQVALVRPGPIQGGAVNPYIERRKRKLAEPDIYEIPYEHHSLQEPLEDTLGTIVYQEQVLEVAMAFADFSPGQAESLRRAMSRKRSEEALERHRQLFVDGACGKHEDVTPELAERIWEKIQGFSGFGFPKAHSAAFGLLAYQSAWLRVHHGPEFLCALLNEQPMGFYPPDSLVHEAQRRRIRVARADANSSLVLCHVESPYRRGEAAEAPGGLVVRIGLGYVKGVRKEEMEALVAERERGGPYRGIADLASRSGAGLASLERLAWAGALDEVPRGAEGERRGALWAVGVSANGRGSRDGTQLALPLEPPAPPRLEPLGEWGELIADYRSTGMVLGRHPMELMRPELDPEILSSSDLGRTADGATVEVAGMVTARQRPETAKGIVFMLIEDERGSVNLIVPPPVYDRHRLVVRASPLIRASGKLERREGTINVVVEAIAELEGVPSVEGAPVGDGAPATGEGSRPGRLAPRRGPAAPDVARPSRREPGPGAPSRRERELVVAELREVAPVGHSFGRRGR